MDYELISYFLGAGASQPFGYPVTKGFKDILAKELTDKFKNKTQSLSSEERILLTILLHKNYPDIEYIFQFQKELTKAIQMFPILFEFLTSYVFGGNIDGVPLAGQSLGVEVKNYIEYSDTLSNFLASKIYEYYSFRDGNLNNAETIYSRLLHLTKQEQTNIYTTNYDNVVEGYCKESKTNYNLVDGFEYDAISRFHKWNPSVFDGKNNPPNTIRLFKLHGSLNWKHHKKYGIITLEEVEMLMKNTSRYSDDVLIKPTISPKEEEQDEPFKTLMDKFGKKIHEDKICIVVGYSFRDQGINEVFNQFLKQKGKIIVVSPNATKEFTDNFIAKNHPNESANESAYKLLDEAVNVEKIDELIELLRSNINH